MGGIKMSIAIDGPSGAGKSTIAKALAKKLNIAYVDTGAMYRALAYAFIDMGDPKDYHQALEKMQLKISPEGIYYKDKLLTDELRTSQVSKRASELSKEPAIRSYLLDYQRKLASDQDVVMEGRDIGTVVLKDAKVKFFLTASDQIRARRRYQQNLEKGIQIPLDQVEKDLKERDDRDRTRSLAPLKQAEDAIVIDNSDLTLEETVEKMAAIVEVKNGTL